MIIFWIIVGIGFILLAMLFILFVSGIIMAAINESHAMEEWSLDDRISR